MISPVFLVCLSLAALPLVILANYFADPKGLRRFPCPSFAGFTQLWLVYHSSTGRRFKTIDAAHRRLGPAVRIAPNHVSFVDPKAYKDIHGHGSPILKEEFYSNVGGGHPSVAQTTSRAEHTRKRKALSHVFSAREITQMEPRVAAIVQKLCRGLQCKSEGRQVSGADAYQTTADGVFDLRPWLNMFSYDAITAMFWSNAYGFLDKGNDLCPSMDELGGTRHVNAMHSFQSAGRFNVMFAQLPQSWHNLVKSILRFTHFGTAGAKFGGMARWQVAKRLEVVPEEPDLFSHLPYRATPKFPTPMPLEELVAESATMMDAGNDTTQTSLTNCLYHLARYPAKQQKLYELLTLAIPVPDSSKPVVSYSEHLQHVPYLRAILDENFRCKPPVSIGLPRRTVSPGANIAGHFIPEGTVVSVPLYSLHHNEKLFDDAWSFVPERWLKPEDGDRDGWLTSEEEASNLREYVLPFSLGGRACIGRNLAYMELSMVVAALVLGFEWELEVAGSEMEMNERFNCNPKELMVRAKVRKGVNWLE